jgi:type VI secretion system protein ImpH
VESNAEKPINGLRDSVVKSWPDEGSAGAAALLLLLPGDTPASALRRRTHLGRQGPAGKEAIRLRPDVSLAFPTQDVKALEFMETPDAGDAAFPDYDAFLGLYGSDSPLPTFYTEDLLWKETNQKAVLDFLDLFHHRVLSLLYRAWEKYRYTIQFQRGGRDDVSRRMFCLIGLGSDELTERTGFPAVRLLRYAGLIIQGPHSASSLL